MKQMLNIDYHFIKPIAKLGNSPHEPDTTQPAIYMGCALAIKALVGFATVQPNYSEIRIHS